MAKLYPAGMHGVEFAAAQDHRAEPGVVRRGAVEGVAAHERGRLPGQRLAVLPLLQHARPRLPVEGASRPTFSFGTQKSV